MKKKVLFLVNHEIVIYNFRREIVERLLSEGFEVIISSPKGEKINELIALGCKFEEIEINRHGKNILEDFKLFYHYQTLLRKVNPDMVFTFTIKPNIYGGIASALSGKPYVANITGLGSAVENTSFLQKLTVLLYKLAFFRVQTVFLQNEENKQFFLDHNIAVNKQKLLPGSGVNLHHFKPLNYPNDKQGLHFVFISRIMKEKGIDQYLEAAKYLKNKYPDTYFHICGFCEEEYESELEKLQNENIIIYHGMVKDIREILKQTHCTIHPTYYPEGLSNVLLESSATARPIITTDRSGCREVVDEGSNGFIVKVKDSEDLIDKIERFIKLDQKEREVMGKKGRTKVETEFDREIVVQEYLNQI